LEALLAETRTERDVARSAGSEQEHENQTLEQQLQERGQVVQQLERDMRKTELFSAQLLRELEDLREQLATEPSDGNPAPGQSQAEAEQTPAASAQLRELQGQVDQLAAIDARRLADLTAARWTISELENRLLASAPSGPLAEELTHARAELQRQAALLSQLGASAPDFEA
jgi:chromosome segregation ATPase